MLPKNAFGVWFAVAATIGAAIAMGIFRMPPLVAQNLPSPTWFLGMWVAGALYCLCAACPLSELSSTFPRSGGTYPYVRLAFGELPAFIVGYMDWGMVTAATALIAMVAGEHLARLLDLAPQAGAYLAVGMVLLFTFAHIWGPKRTSAVQIGTTAIKVAVFVLIIGGLLFFGTPQADMAGGVMPKGAVSWALAIFLAFQAVIATFGGWVLPIYFAGEIRNAGVSLPRSIFRGVLSIAAIYLSMMVVLVIYIPITEIAAQRAPFSYAAQVIFGPVGDKLLTGLVFAILLSALSACVIAAPRVLHALASDGLFFRFAKETSSAGAPINGLLLSSGVVVIYLFTRTFGEMLAVLALYDVTGWLLLIIAVFVLRKTQREVVRPYRAWGHPFTTAIASMVSASFVAAAFILDTRHALVAMGLAACAVPLYFLLTRKRGQMVS